MRLCIGALSPHEPDHALADTLEALRKEQYEVDVPEEIRVRAAKSVERMIAIG